MTNWQFFKSNIKYLYKLYVPIVVIVEERDFHLERCPEAWGYYDRHSNQIVIDKKYDCYLIRLHEYGHWLNARIYLFIDAIWELIWWGLSVRNICKIWHKPKKTSDVDKTT